MSSRVLSEAQINRRNEARRENYRRKQEAKRLLKAQQQQQAPPPVAAPAQQEEAKKKKKKKPKRKTPPVTNLDEDRKIPGAPTPTPDPRTEPLNNGMVAKTSEFAILRPMPAFFFSNRECRLCHHTGNRLDAMHYGRLGLLAFELPWVSPSLEKAVHWSCAIWSDQVFQAGNGRLYNVGREISRTEDIKCAICKKPNASVSCHMCRRSHSKNKMEADMTYHYACLVEHHAKTWGFNARETAVTCPEHKLLQPGFYRLLPRHVQDPDRVVSWHRDKALEWKIRRKLLVEINGGQPETKQTVSTGFVEGASRLYSWPILHAGYQDLQQSENDPFDAMYARLDMKERELYDDGTMELTDLIQSSRKAYPVDEEPDRDDWFLAHTNPRRLAIKNRHYLPVRSSSNALSVRALPRTPEYTRDLVVDHRDVEQHTMDVVDADEVKEPLTPDTPVFTPEDDINSNDSDTESEYVEEEQTDANRRLTERDFVSTKRNILVALTQPHNPLVESERKELSHLIRNPNIVSERRKEVMDLLAQYIMQGVGLRANIFDSTNVITDVKADFGSHTLEIYKWAFNYRDGGKPMLVPTRRSGARNSGEPITVDVHDLLKYSLIDGISGFWGKFAGVTTKITGQFPPPPSEVGSDDDMQ